MTSTRVTLTVGVDAKTAFVAFTDEIDQWWVRGPINYFDSARAVGMRCEPGVGGRLIEVYDAGTGDGLELARITAWVPGELLAWKSSVDNVTVEVRFAPRGDNTELIVTATVPTSGVDNGGSAWVRTVPNWFPAWCERRSTAPGPQPPVARLAVILSYARPVASSRWLTSVFGLRSPSPLPEDDEAPPAWIELRIDNCSVLVRKADDAISTADHEVWMYVEDLDTHYEKVVAGGATIVEGIHQVGYRAYRAEDLEGRRWTFAQAAPNQ